MHKVYKVALVCFLLAAIIVYWVCIPSKERVLLINPKTKEVISEVVIVDSDIIPLGPIKYVVRLPNGELRVCERYELVIFEEE